MKKQKIGKKIALILMGCLILFNLLTAFFSITGLNAKGILPLTFLTVESGSMEPEMSVGDLLIDWEVPYENLEIGDDVTFQRNDEFITHRIIRKEGSRIVTRGLANNTEDPSFGPQDYCAKVILVIPLLGYVLDFLSRPLCLLTALLVIAGLFYGTQYADWILNKAEKKKTAQEQLPEGEEPEAAPARKSPSFDWGSPVKVLAMVLAMSILLVSPMMTQAKYVAIIDARKAAVADTLYMSSNLLTAEGASYTITGWSGTAKGLTLNINNYDNDLKHNEAGKDLLYAVRIVKLTESSDKKSYSTNYSVNVDSAPAAAAEDLAAKFTWPADIPDGDSYGPYLLPGNSTPDQEEGKYGRTHKLDLVVKGDTANPLQAGDTIRFKLYATTSDSYGYRITLSGDYTLVVAGGTSFIEGTSTSTSPGNILVGYNIKTGLLNGSGYRSIKISWNSQRMYLNEYEKSAFDTLLNYKRSDGTYDPSLYYRGTGQNNDTAFLVLPLPAYANVTLQFFKQDGFLYEENDQFVITAAEEAASDNQ